MPSIKIRDNDSFESALHHFKRACDRAGIVAEVRDREFYEKPTWARKRAKATAKKRLFIRLLRERSALGGTRRR